MDVSARSDHLATQIDLLVVDGDICVVVEAKSKLSNDDVDEHTERMEMFKRLFPRYSDMRAMGAVAAMVLSHDVARYAYRQGFFVITSKLERGSWPQEYAAKRGRHLSPLGAGRMHARRTRVVILAASGRDGSEGQTADDTIASPPNASRWSCTPMPGSRSTP